MPYALCPMPYALCPMPHALCTSEHVTEKGYIAKFDDHFVVAPREGFGEIPLLKEPKLHREFVPPFPNPNIVQTELKSCVRVPKLSALPLTVPLTVPTAAEFLKLSVFLREIEGKPNKNRPPESPAESQHQKHPQRQPLARQSPRGSV